MSSWLTKKTIPGNVLNVDNDYLGAWPCGGSLVVGHVDEINGSGSEEMCGFVPTRHELAQLAKYWAEVAVKIDFPWFLPDGPGCREICLERCAEKRIRQIGQLLGMDSVNKIVAEVTEAFHDRWPEGLGGS